jgi:hypothetical protein
MKKFFALKLMVRRNSSREKVDASLPYRLRLSGSNSKETPMWNKRRIAAALASLALLGGAATVAHARTDFLRIDPDSASKSNEGRETRAALVAQVSQPIEVERDEHGQVEREEKVGVQEHDGQHGQAGRNEQIGLQERIERGQVERNEQAARPERPERMERHERNERDGRN